MFFENDFMKPSLGNRAFRRQGNFLGKSLMAYFRGLEFGEISRNGISSWKLIFSFFEMLISICFNWMNQIFTWEILLEITSI